MPDENVRNQYVNCAYCDKRINVEYDAIIQVNTGDMRLFLHDACRQGWLKKNPGATVVREPDQYYRATHEKA